MRKAALLALPLLALNAVSSQAAILQLSYDATVMEEVGVYDDYNVYGYQSLAGQQARVTVRIDLNAMPPLNKGNLVHDTTRNWMSISAQFTDRLVRSADFSPSGFEHWLEMIDLGDGSYRLEGSTNLDRPKDGWNLSWFSLRVPSALGELLTQRNGFSATLYTNTLTTFDQGYDLCSEPGSYSGNCDAPVFAQGALLLYAENAVVTAQLLDSPTEVPLPASAWLFGSALLGLGARRFAKA